MDGHSKSANISEAQPRPELNEKGVLAVSNEIPPPVAATVRRPRTGCLAGLYNLFTIEHMSGRAPTPAAYQARSFDKAQPQTLWGVIKKFFRFFGPGAIISVAYIDPDNYQTAISAGGDFQYKLLFMIAVSNIIGIYLQVRK